MNAHKYNYEVTDIEALEKACPKAVEVVKKPVRAVITKLLDCGMEIPGVTMIIPQLPETQQEATQPEPSKTEFPAFLKKQA